MTYSIAARCARTGAYGIAITSSSICVASRCAWVSRHGVVATQNVTDPQLGALGLLALADGLAADAVMARLIAATPHSAWRQLAVVGRDGPGVAHSGANALPLAAISHAADCVAMGNLLVNEHVPAAMTARFNSMEGQTLAERLLAALEAGLDAGGEIDDEHAAGLKVASGHDWPVVDLRVDWHEQPITGLRSLWQRYAPQQSAFIARALDPQSAPSF